MNEAPIEIVPYVPAHLESVVGLSLRAWEPVFESLHAALDEDVYRAFFPDWRKVQSQAVTAACESPEHDTWVAMTDGTVTGFVDVMMHSDGVLGEIHMVAVHPEQQHRGVGRRLTDFAVERLREKGASVAMVETGGDPGHEPARRTYEQAGFRLFPVARYFKKL